MTDEGPRTAQQSTLHESLRQKAERHVVFPLNRDECLMLIAAVEVAEAKLATCRKERDEVYAVNAAANYDRANAAEAALQDIVALCEPDRIPLPLLNSKVIRRAKEALNG